MARKGLLPTLTVKGNYSRKGASSRSGDGLATALSKQGLLPTLRASSGGGADSHGRPQLSTAAGGPLNPQWLEWFMGFPVGWTNPLGVLGSERLVTPWCQPALSGADIESGSSAMDLEHLRTLGQDGPTVTPGAWTYSASQLRKFHDCPRAWFFQKILNYPTPTSEAAELGKSLHSQVENYIKDGTEPEDERAWLLLRNLGSIDLSREDLTVEGHIKFLVDPSNPGGPRFQGFIDLTVPGAVRVIVWDHKTTSNLKWAKSEHELHHDIQMVSYAHWVFSQCADVDEVEVVHSYVTTRGVPEQRVVRAVLTRAEVAERWAELEKLITEMERVRALEDVRKVSVNLDSCSKYGGCPHASVCARAQMGMEVGMFNPPDAADGREEVIEMDPAITAKLEALRAKAKGPDAAPAPTPEAKIETKLEESVTEVKAPAPTPRQVHGPHELEPVPEPEAQSKLSPEVEALDLGARAKRALLQLGVTTVEDLLVFEPKRATEVQGVGAGAVEQIASAIEALAPRENEGEAVETSTIEHMKETAAQVLGASPVPEPALADEVIEGQEIVAENAGLTLENLVQLSRELGVKITIEVAP